MKTTPIPGRSAFEVLALGRRFASELAREAVDTTAKLTLADRHALATLAIAVDVEASRRAGVEPLTAKLTPLLAADLARIERAAIPTDPAPLQAAG